MSFGFSVGDFATASQLAWRLYRDCYQVARGAPQEFRLLVGEISQLSNSLQLLQEEVRDPNSTLVRAGEERVRMVNEMVLRIHVTLKELQMVAKRYGIMDDKSKLRRIWIKFQWSVEYSRIDSLRSKLIYHNTVMSLLLTSVGNSSLKRIESLSEAIETDVKEIKGIIRASSEDRTGRLPSTPLASVIDDEYIQATLSTAMMKMAEVTQPWSTIGVTQWIQSGRWWLLKSQEGLYSTHRLGASQIVSLTAYVNLIKTAWILIDVIACHPQLSFLDTGTHAEVQILSTELKKEFQKIQDLHLEVPSLQDVEEQDLQIWETQARAPLLQPGKKAQQLDIDKASGTSWIVGGENIFFRKFAFFERSSLPEAAPCIVLVLVHKMTMIVRIVALDQNGAALLGLTLHHGTVVQLDGASTIVNNERINFTSSQDAEHLYCVIEAADFYFVDRTIEHVQTSFDNFRGYILLSAVKNGYQEVVLQLLESSIVPESSKGDTLATQGTFLGRITTLVSNFVKGKAKPVSRSGISWNKVPFEEWEILCGYEDFIELTYEDMVSACPEKHLMDIYLWLAVKSKCVPVVRLLLEKGASPDSTNDTIGPKGTPKSPSIHTAIRNEDLPMVSLLLEKGANPMTTLERKRTALHHASTIGNLEIVELLLRTSVEIDAKDEDSTTALHLASKNGREGVVKTLLAHGADMEIRDNAEMTALHCASATGNLEIVELLLQASVEINAKDKDSTTALHLASKNNREGVVKTLLAHGADMEIRDNARMTAYHYAISNSKHTITSLLLAEAIKRSPLSTKVPRQRREHVHLWFDSDWGLFILDSKDAFIEYPDVVSGDIESRSDKSFRITHGMGPHFFKTEIRFSIIHNGRPLDFTVGHGSRGVNGEGSMKFEILNGGVVHCSPTRLQGCNIQSFVGVDVDPDAEYVF